MGSAAVFGNDALGTYAGRRALVLGATGFIGRRVAGLLAALGARVHATGRDATALDDVGDATWRTVADLADARQVEDLLADARPDVVFNLAGYGVDRAERADVLAERLNAQLPAQLAALLAAGPRARWGGLRLVHVGSALEYGTAAGDLHEDTAPLPTTTYGRTKLRGTLGVAERAAATGLPAATARLFTVYGPGEHAGRLLPALVQATRTGAPLELTAGDQLRDFTFVDDVAQGLLRIGLAAVVPGEVVNLATGRLTTVRAFAERAARVLGLDPALLRFGTLPTRPEEMAHEPVATGRLRALTGWAPATGIEEGVARTVAGGAPTARPAVG